ncbi:efflux RND transporter periplasmic adaptor subunit [Pseudalkalibacillus sp. SCS-8]|uniref:efflux RND transporter periplasmic adaptor subunit n=1 Tax=Pseudalkalibacillus nanhaiensis TaxID=3115291 RepID=UPI0032DABBA5
MNRYIKRALIVLPIVLFVIVNTYLFVLNKSLFASEKPYDAYQIDTHDMRDTIEMTGIIMPEEKEEFFYDESYGALKEILVEEGEEVSAEDEILAYHTENLEARITALENEVEVLETEKDYHEDRETLISNQILQEESKEDDEKNETTIFLLEQEEAEAAYQADRIDTIISNKESEITQLETQSEEVTIKSSISGKVQEVTTQRGANKAPLVVVVNDDDLFVQAFLSEKEALFVNEGDEVKLQSVKGEEWDGLITSVQPAPEHEKEGMFKIEIEFVEDDTTEFQIGHTLNVTVKPVVVEDAIAVKPENILYEDGHEYVFVVENDYVDKRKVQLGFKNDELVQVTKGLKAGEHILMEPNRLLVDNMEIEVKVIPLKKVIKTSVETETDSTETGTSNTDSSSTEDQEESEDTDNDSSDTEEQNDETEDTDSESNTDSQNDGSDNTNTDTSDTEEQDDGKKSRYNSDKKDRQNILDPPAEERDEDSGPKG